MKNLMPIAYAYFQDVYNRSYEYSKLVDGVIVDKESHFTFAEDLSVYRNKKDISAYVERLLNRFKSSGLQSYYEMILALEQVSWVFYYNGLENLSQCCTDWVTKLKNLDGGNYHRKYITDAQMDAIYNLD